MAPLGCLERSAHTRMSWLVAGHSNGSCLHWTGLNSRPSWPSLHAICGMAAADTLKGAQNRQEALLLLLVFFLSRTQLCSWERLCLTAATCFLKNAPAMRNTSRVMVSRWMTRLSAARFHATVTQYGYNCCRCKVQATRTDEVGCKYICTYISLKHLPGLPSLLWLGASLQLRLQH